MNGLQMKYFVLKPAGNGPYAIASRNAMLAYAEEIQDENRDLFLDLVKWVSDEERKAQQALDGRD